ncbi:MAG: hypothetical protein MJZ04_06375 [Bacteroidales bacterium]|nr:hypothetical protein [Bacteroidales bacterium]
MHIQALIISLLLSAAFPQGRAADFHSAYESEWNEAVSYADAHRQAWRRIWDFFGVDSRIAEAVVFPEMVRYGAFQDQMETMAVRGTYVRGGTKVFNFSIGRFQMKPSFVEDLEKRWMKSPYARQYDARFITDDNQIVRRERLDRMADDLWQCVYVAMFLKLLYLDYGSVDSEGRVVRDGIDQLPEDEQLRLAATAYNRGCSWSSPGTGDIEGLASSAGDRHFHMSVFPSSTTRRFNYGDIASEYFNSL